MSSADVLPGPDTETVGQDVHPDVASHVLEMLQGSGLASIVARLQGLGLDQVVSSWIGKGSNLPISPDQLQGLFSAEQLQALAAKLGLNPSELLGQISKVLPAAVDKLTPDGQLPSGDLLQQGVGILKQLLGGFLGGKSAPDAPAPPTE